MKDHGRLTLTDVLFLLVGIIALRAFYPVFIDQLNQNAGMFGRGTELLFLTILPVAVLVMLGYIYLRSGVAAR